MLYGTAIYNTKRKRMSQNIKSTIYRFVTMRAPQLIEEGEQSINFVQYPKEIASSLVTAAKSITNDDNEESTKLAIKNAINEYIPVYASNKELSNSNPAFYEFSKWLIKNRKTLTTENTLSRAIERGIQPLSNSELKEIWDDLYYSILTQGTAYLRDQLLSFLVADFFIRNMSRVEETNEAFQKLAQARVIIDRALFQESNVKSGNLEPTPISEKSFEKSLEIAAANVDNEQLEHFKKEINLAQNIYRKEEEKAREAYQKVYDNSLKQAYNNATLTERVITDPETGVTTKLEEYQNLVIPEFEYTIAEELGNLATNTRLSEDVKRYINELKTIEAVESYAEVLEIIDREIAINTEKIFKNTSFEQKQVSVLGATLPVANTLPVTPFAYQCCMTRVRGGINSYNVSMAIKVPNNSYTVVSTLYHMHYQNGVNNTSGYFEETKGNAINTLKFYQGGISYDGPIEKFTGEITFSNGRKYNFEVRELAPKLCGTGMLIGETSPPEEVIPTSFGIQRLGIADYRRVEQEVCCYVPGEVSHIENIMAREFKEKSTRRLRRDERTDTRSTERERENLTEATSTDRFEMNQEVAALSAKDQSIAAGVGASYSSGPVSINANASYASNTTKEESNSQALNHAKELTERALDRIVEKVREERVTKVVEEYEENNTHGYDNREGATHVSGVYRWIDKVYNNKVINYGKRLMYEFMIPEPATFHDLAIQLKAEGNGEEVLTKPIDPRTAGSLRLLDHKALTESNFKYWAAIYNVNIDAQLQETIFVNKSYSKTNDRHEEGRFEYALHEKAEIPENYQVKNIDGYFTCEQGHSGRTHHIRGLVTVAGEKFRFDNRTELNLRKNLSHKKIINSLEFSVTSWDVGAFAFNLSIECQLKSDIKETWQLNAFNAIIEAYEEKLATYYEKLAALTAKQGETVRVNPGLYRQLEKTVLRKNCITYLLGQEQLGHDMLQGRDDLSTINARYTDPNLDSYAARVKFFEQAFEWDIMSYYFYPFYWAKKDNWETLYTIQNDDPLFKTFLQSGMAKVVVTVRPGFEEMVNWYIATGQIWNGGQVPTLNDPEFVSIVQELREPEGEVEETWESRVPTSLTVVQAGAIGLDVEGLPCNPDCGGDTSNPIVQTDDQIGGGDDTTDPDTTDPKIIGVGTDIVGQTVVQ